MSYEVPQEFRAIRLTPIEADELPVPGGSYVSIHVDDDTGGVVCRYSDAATHSILKAGATISGATYTVTTSGGDCAITPAAAALTIGKAAHVTINLGPLKISVVDATPEGAVTSPVGSLAIDKTAGTIYLKTTGTGNTGWTQLQVVT